jgi:hypothetical protein
MLQNLVQFAPQSSAFSKKKKEKRKKKKKRKTGWWLSPEADRWLCLFQPSPGTSWLLCAIKRCFKGWLLNLMCTPCAGGNLVSKKIRITQV